MSQVYLKYDDQGNILLTHFMPLDPIHGLGKTATQLKAEGYLGELPPEPERVAGKEPLLKMNVSMKTPYWEMVDRPLTPDEELAQLKAQLKITQDALDALLLG
ncbi:hypothetical protein [Brevibacillus gelatini]